MAVADKDDKTIIYEYLNGDEKSLEILIQRYLKPIYSFVYRNVGDQAFAEDITQEVFVKVWKNIKKFDQKRDFKPWIFQIAKNASIDYLRKKKSIPFSRFENERGENALIENMASEEVDLIETISDKETISLALKNLSEKDQKIAQKYGVLWTKYDMSGEWIIGQSISTLQNNNFMINSDGTSYEVSVMRIAGQLNKEIVYNSYIDLMKSENGPNRGSISPAILEAWLKKYLKSKTVSDINPSNLILGFEQIVIKVNQDAYEITYGFFANTPINKLLWTGLMLDKNLIA